jgi:hypothetical protein
MKNSYEIPIAIIKTVWGSAAGMVVVAGVFTGGESTGKYIAMSVPPIAATATTAIVLNHAKKTEQPQAAIEMQQIESRLTTLETIVTAEQPDLLKHLPHPPSTHS